MLVFREIVKRVAVEMMALSLDGESRTTSGHLSIFIVSPELAEHARGYGHVTQRHSLIGSFLDPPVTSTTDAIFR